LLGNPVVWFTASGGIIVYVLMFTFFLLRRRRACCDLTTGDYPLSFMHRALLVIAPAGQTDRRYVLG